MSVRSCPLNLHLAVIFMPLLRWDAFFTPSSAVSVELGNSVLAGIDALSGESLVVVTDGIREVAELSPMNDDLLWVDHPTLVVVLPLILGVCSEVMLNDVDSAPEVGVIAKHFYGV